MNYTIINNEGTTAVTLVHDGKVYVTGTGNPNLETILEGIAKGDESVIDLFDLSKVAGQKFERLSDRVTVDNGRLYFDGDEVDNSLAEQVVRFIREGVKDYEPLVKFFENVQQNPVEHSREQLYDWLKTNGITLTPEGFIIGYKGVRSKDGKNFESGFTGTAYVNDVKHTGHIPQTVGDVVTMPRSEVAHDPSTACSTGLHVGTFSYAKSYQQGAMLEVHVNPRDVVSVPTDAHGEKVRVCRYKIVGTVEVPYESALLGHDEDDFGDDDLYCWNCGGEGHTEADCSSPNGTDENEPQMPPFDPTGTEDETPVADLDDETVSVPGPADEVKVGDVYETTDKRRAGTQFKVESIEGDEAVGKSLPRNLTRKVALDRLKSYRYRKV